MRCSKFQLPLNSGFAYGMSPKTFDADFGVKDARWLASRTENFVVLGTAKRDVADHFGRNIQMSERFAGGRNDGDATFAGLFSMKIGDPQIALGVECTTVASCTA